MKTQLVKLVCSIVVAVIALGSFAHAQETNNRVIPPTDLSRLSGIVFSKISELSQLKNKLDSKSVELCAWDGTSRNILSYIRDGIMRAGSVDAFESQLNSAQAISLYSIQGPSSDLEIALIPKDGVTKEIVRSIQVKLKKEVEPSPFFDQLNVENIETASSRLKEQRSWEAISAIAITANGVVQPSFLNVDINGENKNLSQWGLEQFSNGIIELRLNESAHPSVESLFRQIVRDIGLMTEFGYMSTSTASVSAIQNMAKELTSSENVAKLRAIVKSLESLDANESITSVQAAQLNSLDIFATRKLFRQFGIESIVRKISEKAFFMRFFAPLKPRPVNFKGIEGKKLGKSIVIYHGASSLRAARNIARSTQVQSHLGAFIQTRDPLSGVVKSKAISAKLGDGFYGVQGDSAATNVTYGIFPVQVQLNPNAIVVSYQEFTKNPSLRRKVDAIYFEEVDANKKKTGNVVWVLKTDNAIARNGDGTRRISFNLKAFEKYLKDVVSRAASGKIQLNDILVKKLVFGLTVFKKEIGLNSINDQKELIAKFNKINSAAQYGKLFQTILIKNPNNVTPLDKSIRALSQSAQAVTTPVLIDWPTQGVGNPTANRTTVESTRVIVEFNGQMFTIPRLQNVTVGERIGARVEGGFWGYRRVTMGDVSAVGILPQGANSEEATNLLSAMAKIQENPEAKALFPRLYGAYVNNEGQVELAMEAFDHKINSYGSSEAMSKDLFRRRVFAPRFEFTIMASGGGLNLGRDTIEDDYIFYDREGKLRFGIPVRTSGWASRVNRGELYRIPSIPSSNEYKKGSMPEINEAYLRNSFEKVTFETGVWPFRRQSTIYVVRDIHNSMIKAYLEALYLKGVSRFYFGRFNIPALAEYLVAWGLKLGVPVFTQEQFEVFHEAAIDENERSFREKLFGSTFGEIESRAGRAAHADWMQRKASYVDRGNPAPPVTPEAWATEQYNRLRSGTSAERDMILDGFSRQIAGSLNVENQFTRETLLTSRGTDPLTGRTTEIWRVPGTTGDSGYVEFFVDQNGLGAGKESLRIVSIYGIIERPGSGRQLRAMLRAEHPGLAFTGRLAGTDEARFIAAIKSNPLSPDWGNVPALRDEFGAIEIKIVYQNGQPIFEYIAYPGRDNIWLNRIENLANPSFQNWIESIKPGSRALAQAEVRKFIRYAVGPSALVGGTNAVVIESIGQLPGLSPEDSRSILLDQLRRLHPELPIIVPTTAADRQAIIEAIRQNPINPDFTKVNTLLGSQTFELRVTWTGTGNSRQPQFTLVMRRGDALLWSNRLDVLRDPVFQDWAERIAPGSRALITREVGSASSLTKIKAQVAALLIAGGAVLGTSSDVQGAPNKMLVNVPLGPSDLPTILARDSVADPRLGTGIKWRVEPASVSYRPLSPLTLQVEVPRSSVAIDPVSRTYQFISSPDLTRAIDAGNPKLRLTFAADNPLPAATTAVNLTKYYQVSLTPGSPEARAYAGIRGALLQPFNPTSPLQEVFSDTVYQPRLAPVVQQSSLPSISSYAGNPDAVDTTILRYDSGGNPETLHLGYAPLAIATTAMNIGSMMALGMSSASAPGRRLIGFGNETGVLATTDTWRGYGQSGGRQASANYSGSYFNAEFGNVLVQYAAGHQGAITRIRIGDVVIVGMSVKAANGIGPTATSSGTSSVVYGLKMGINDNPQIFFNTPDAIRGFANMPLEVPAAKLFGLSVGHARAGLATSSFLINALGSPALVGAFDQATSSLVDDPTGAGMNQAFIAGAGNGAVEALKAFDPRTLHGLGNDASLGLSIWLDSASRLAGGVLGAGLAAITIGDTAANLYEGNQAKLNNLNENLALQGLQAVAEGHPERLAQVQGIIHKTGYDPFNPNDPYVRNYIESDLSWGESVGKFLVDRQIAPHNIFDNIADLAVSRAVYNDYGKDMSPEEWVEFKSKQVGFLSNEEEIQTYMRMEEEKIAADIVHREAIQSEEYQAMMSKVAQPGKTNGMFDFGEGQEGEQENKLHVAAPRLRLDDPMVDQIRGLMGVGMQYDISKLKSIEVISIMSNLDRTLAALSVSPIRPSDWNVTFDRPLPANQYNAIAGNFLTDPLFTAADKSIWTPPAMALDPYSATYNYLGQNYSLGATENGLVPVNWTPRALYDTGLSYGGSSSEDISSIYSDLELFEPANVTINTTPVGGTTPNTPTPAPERKMSFREMLSISPYYNFLRQNSSGVSNTYTPQFILCMFNNCEIVGMPRPGGP